MQDIEKLAQSVLGNAEQEPPKEVWEGIEARLRSQAAAKTVRTKRWQWMTAAGVVVAGAVAFVLTRGETTEPVARVTLLDTTTETIVAEDPMTVETSQQEEVVRTGKPATAVQTEEQAVAVKEHSNADYNNEEDEEIFDLLEYQLSSHEYDIPAREQASSTTQQKKEGTSQTTAVPKTESSQAKTSTRMEISLNIPNILTPNGDGYNDCWTIPDLAKYGRTSVQIFTAQGKRIYASDNYRGDFCGDDLPADNYFYTLTISEHNYSRRGVLVIKR